MPNQPTSSCSSVLLEGEVVRHEGDDVVALLAVEISEDVEVVEVEDEDVIEDVEASVLDDSVTELLVLVIELLLLVTELVEVEVGVVGLLEDEEESNMYPPPPMATTKTRTKTTIIRPIPLLWGTKDVINTETIY